MSIRNLRVAVVGGGIIGAATARRRALTDADVTLFEKEDRLAAHQTGHNSGVVHAGLYYTPGSLKAQLCRRGVELLQTFTTEKGLPYDECGKVVVALDESELGRLDAIFSRATANGVPGIRRIGASCFATAALMATRSSGFCDAMTTKLPPPFVLVVCS